jgi:hypothetical protein
MIRKGSIILGLALAALAAFGLWADRHAVILFFDIVAAVVAFGIAALEREDELGASRGVGPVVLGLGLAALWIAGLATHQPRWATWANFLAACASLSLGVVAASRGQHVVPATPRRR